MTLPPPSCSSCQMPDAVENRLVWLRLQDPERLAVWMDRIATAVPHAARIIELQQASERQDVGEMRRLIRHIIFPTDKLTWRHDLSHSAQVEHVVALIREMMLLEQAEAVQNCCEEALDALDIAMQYLDEGVAQSSSYEQILNLHLAACRACPPDPEHLFNWLLRKRADCLFGLFDRASQSYAELLKPTSRLAIDGTLT
jgi:hypothetical protein